MTISTNIIAAINNMCSGSETKVLLAVLGYETSTMSTSQMQKVTGITRPNNYFRVRKKLIDMNYLIIDDAGMHVNADKILSDYANSSY